MNKFFLLGCFLSFLLTNTAIQTAAKQDPFNAFIEQALSTYLIDEKIVGGLQIIHDNLLQAVQDEKTVKKLKTIRALLKAFKETSDTGIEITNLLYEEALQAFKIHLQISKFEEYLQRKKGQEKLNKAIQRNIDTFLLSMRPPAPPVNLQIEINDNLQKTIVNTYLLLLQEKLQNFIQREQAAQKSKSRRSSAIKQIHTKDAQSTLKEILRTFAHYEQTTHLILSQELLSKLSLTLQSLENLAQEIKDAQITTPENLMIFLKRRFSEQ